MPPQPHPGKTDPRGASPLPPPFAALEVEEISTSEGLERVRPEWSRLWAKCPGTTPFQSPRWLIPWWEHLGRGELWVCAVRHKGELTGLAPLFIDKRRAFFLGTGISDCLDLLVDPACPEAAGALLRHLVAAGERWDYCDLQEVPPESAAIRQIAAQPLPDVQCSVDPLGICPVLLLTGIPEPSPADHPALRTSYRRAWRRIIACGEARVEMAEKEDLAFCLDALFRLHGARWAKRRHPGVLSDLKVRSFHRVAAGGLLEDGCLRLFSLLLDGEIIASLYAFEQNGKLYCYLSGFNPHLERLSPGKIVLGSAIEYAVRTGISEVNFLRGSEVYKYQWGARDRPNYRILIKQDRLVTRPE